MGELSFHDTFFRNLDDFHKGMQVIDEVFEPSKESFFDDSNDKVSIKMGTFTLLILASAATSSNITKNFYSRLSVPKYSVEELVENEAKIEKSLSVFTPEFTPRVAAHDTVDFEDVEIEREIIQVYQKNMKAFIQSKRKRRPV